MNSTERALYTVIEEKIKNLESEKVVGHKLEYEKIIAKYYKKLTKIANSKR